MRARLALPILLFAATACVAATPVFPDASPSSTPRPKPSEAGPVLLIGDSIMVGARDEGGLAGLLEEDGWIPEIVAENSREAEWALARIEERSAVPRRVIVEIGTNPSPVVRNFAAEVRALIEALTQRGAKRIYWIPPQSIDPALYAERAQIVRDAASSTVVVSGWADFLVQNPQLFQSDGLHLTQEGYVQLALFIRDELAR
jgi:lysophospholipase L1-like esterase